MALTKCHECGKEIADTAKACPACGAPSKLTQEISKAKARFAAGCGLLLSAPLVILAAFALFLLIAYVFN